jgi:hypothetical protein
VVPRWWKRGPWPAPTRYLGRVCRVGVGGIVVVVVVVVVVSGAVAL